MCSAHQQKHYNGQHFKGLDHDKREEAKYGDSNDDDDGDDQVDNDDDDVDNDDNDDDDDDDDIVPLYLAQLLPHLTVSRLFKPPTSLAKISSSSVQKHSDNMLCAFSL